MPHRLYLPDLEPPTTPPTADWLLNVSGDEARHAVAVKRVQVGEEIELRNGRGLIALGSVTRIDPPRGKHPGGLDLRIDSHLIVPPTAPSVEVWSATPKGDRVDQLVDQLSQVGAACWRPLSTERGVVDPRDTKLARLERLAIEACKQCGRAWTLRLDARADFPAALAPATGTAIVMADGDAPVALPAVIAGATTLRLLIGPEGGWSERERDQARAAGAALVRFGPLVMRTETAAVVAAARLVAVRS